MVKVKQPVISVVHTGDWVRKLKMADDLMIN